MAAFKKSSVADMPRLQLFYRLMIRPLGAEPVRTALTVLAIALGVAVVLAIDLAGNAATGSFRSSLETLAGDQELEIVATGGVPEAIVGALTAMPYPLQISPRIDDYAVVADTRQSVALIGLDLVAQTRDRSTPPQAAAVTNSEDALKYIGNYDSIWVGKSLKRRIGDRIALLINDHLGAYTVRGVFPDSDGNAAAIVMDIAAAQQALGRPGVVDRVLVKVPHASPLEVWQQRFTAMLPAGVGARLAGTGTAENRKMLAAFRWNLRLLSYIALVVGAFLIYNTISVSVVRRRADIGIVRALGASRATVLFAFLGEAFSLGLLGTSLGLPFGRWLASGAVKLMSTTVDSLYVSSRPGPLDLNASAVTLALVVGIGVSVASAYSPASEASQVSPVEAMARGRREYVAGVHKLRDLYWAFALGAGAVAASRAPAVGGTPLFGYLATLLLIVASALAIPAFIAGATHLAGRLLGKLLGVEALLAARSLSASLRRTSVLVGALSTSIAMMTAVGIMVGSFRQTVLLWMEDQLPADLYMRPAGNIAADRHPTISTDLVETIAHLPGVAAIDRLREYEISLDGMPAGLGSIELNILRSYRNVDFLSGRATNAVRAELRRQNTVIVSEPFANKHRLRAGDSITLPMGETRAAFRIVDVYYDYSSERGTILMDRETLLRYLPDPAPSNLAIYVAPGTSIPDARVAIEHASAGRRVLLFTNRDLRGEALRIFDRTFAITYALEAVAVLIAVMGVAGALLALVIDRRRELALLRFLGAASAQIRKLIVVEAALLGLFATAAGLALGFAISLILVFVINKQSFGWTIRFHWPVAVLVGALSVVYLATVLAGLYPANIAVRLRPIEVVHED
jgi:putative ABC transport system permease protein